MDSVCVQYSLRSSCNCTPNSPHFTLKMANTLNKTHIVQGQDGVYRWVYELPMLANPSMLFTMWKVMGIALCVPTLLMLVLGLMKGQGLQAVTFALQIMLLSLCGILALSLPAYLIVAARYDWKYAMRFAMDERGIRITPAKVVIIGWQLRLAAAWGSFDRYTEFSQVKSIRVYPRYHLIKVNAPLRKNQVYQPGEKGSFLSGGG